MGTEFFILALLFGGSLFYLGSPFFEKPASKKAGDGSVRFCPQCGTKRQEKALFCIHCGQKLAMIFFFFVFLFSTGLRAENPPNTMPPINGMEVGVLKGTLFIEKEKGKKEILPDFVVALMVFQNGQRVLMLDKKTDGQGRFEFKNIFKDEGYTYTVGTIFDDMLYLISNLTLSKDKDSIEVEFFVGPKSPYLVGSASEMMKETPESKGTMATPDSPRMTPAVDKPKGFADKPYQKLALGLSVLVLVFVFYLSKRKDA